MWIHSLGHSATSSGWRKQAAEAIAPRVPVDDRKVRTALGLIFLASSIRYVVKTLRGAAR
ncbi:MAG TPA: hypothetical protein VI408_08535 [Gaiellaceae bacterium]